MQVLLPDLFAQVAQRPGRSAAQRVDAVDLLDRDAGDLGHDAVGDRGGAAAVRAGTLAGGWRGGLVVFAGAFLGATSAGVCVWIVNAITPVRIGGARWRRHK